MKNFFYNLSILQSHLSEHFSSEKYLHNERYALPHERTGFSAETPSDYGLLLGVDEFGRYLQITTSKKRKQLGNVLYAAPSQKGKSNTFKHQLKHWKGSVIVNNIKAGELDEETSEIRAGFSDIYRIDLQGGGNHFDPLMGKNTEDDLYAVAKLLLYEPNEQQPAFTQRGIEILTILFLAARAAPIPPFLFVREVTQLGINGVARRINEISPSLAKRFLDGDYSESKNYSENTYLENSWTSAKARIYPFVTENVVKSLTGSDFRIADLLLGERPVTIYLNWPESKLFALQPVMKLLWGTFTSELKDTYDNLVKLYGKKITARFQKILFLIDEGGVTPVPELYKHVSTLNGRGMFFEIGVQDFSQLDALYGRYNAKTILNNCAKVFFQQESIEMAKIVREYLGGKSAFSSSQTIHGDETSEGKHEQKIPLMSEQEIMGMDETILIRHRDLRYMIKAKRLPEFVKPAVAPDDLPLLSPIPEVPLLPAPRVDTWRRASEAYPLVFAEREMSDGTTLGL
jgi:type IV secretory pathway TraG/TraD family ATPase VirD4